MTGLVAIFVASFAGSAAGIGVASVLSWRYYIKPRMAKAGRQARIRAMRPPSPASQATATTPGFVRHEGDVTITGPGWGRAKKTVHR